MPSDRVIVSLLADSDANRKGRTTMHYFKSPQMATEIRVRKKIKRWNKNIMKAAGDVLYSSMATIIFNSLYMLKCFLFRCT